MTMIRALALLIALGLSAAAAHAQSLTAGGALYQNIQRFDGDRSLNRLDGVSAGWMIVGGARIGHWVVRGEGSRDGTIRNVQTTSLTVNARPVTIQSELSHNMREVAVLGGYAHNVTGRFEITLLGGLSAVTVHRSFTTDAGLLILVPPSTVPATSVTTTFVDRFTVWTVQADVVGRAAHRLGVIGGIRVQPISLADDLSGRSIRLFGGLVWRLK
jgi:hypothetical protein